MTGSRANTGRRALALAGALLLAIWAFTWLRALADFRLPFADHTWITNPAFGADFWTEPDYAARLWKGGVDPYENERHLFHYPPIVIRLFLWTPFFSFETALRIWIAVLTLLVVLGAVLAHRTRRRVAAGDVPLPVLLAVVLFGFPVVYALERANFDLVTLAAILVAVPLLSAESRAAEFLAGAVLALGPWVKIYPGLVGIALVALRRFRAVAGFLLGGVLVFAAMPGETLRSFRILRIAVERVRASVDETPLATWSHSLSVAWVRALAPLRGTAIHRAVSAVPASAVALCLVLAAVVPVCLRVYRAKDSRELTYPLLLWVVAAASFVPDIANDYSLVFLPLAALSVLGKDEPRLAVGCLAAGAVAYQPIAVPIPGAVLLVSKVLFLVAVGASIARRAAHPLADGAGAGDASAGSRV